MLRIMTRLASPSLERFTAAPLQPATVAERGVHAPFTTPALFAARLRPAPSKGLELVVANPSGQRAWLVLPWSSALDSCQPSLADRALIAALASQKPTPLNVWDAARQVASSGLAGRRAARAAAAQPAPSPAAPAPATFDAIRLHRFARSLLDWRPHGPAEEDRTRAAALAERATAAAHAAVALQAAPGPEGRAAWVLDGWGLLAALWQVAGPEHRPSLLRRLAALTPMPSDDMLAWPGCSGLGGAGPPDRPGPQRDFVTQPVCEAALVAWFAPS